MCVGVCVFRLSLYHTNAQRSKHACRAVYYSCCLRWSLKCEPLTFSDSLPEFLYIALKTPAHMSSSASSGWGFYTTGQFPSLSFYLGRWLIFFLFFCFVVVVVVVVVVVFCFVVVCFVFVLFVLLLLLLLLLLLFFCFLFFCFFTEPYQRI